MELNNSCIEIIKYLRECDDYVKIQELARKYKLTDRAIRYKLDKIEAFLVKNGFQYLEKQHLKGVRIINEPKLQEFLDEFLGKYTPYKYTYSKEERFEFMLMKILQSNRPIKLSYFQTKLCISKNTVSKEFQEIENWLSERNLKIIRKPKVGVIVIGSEKLKRDAIMEITSKTISTEDIVNYVNKKTSKSKINNLQFETLFSDIDLDFIDNLIKNVEIQLNKEFSDEAYGSLITHIALMIKRIQLNTYVTIPEINLDNLKEKSEYKIAKNMLIRIEKHYNIKAPEEEISYITLHLLGARIIKSNEFYKDEYKSDDLYKVCKIMTEEIERIYNVSFEPNKHKVIEGLVLHLRPSIYRIKFNLKLVNPLYDEIRLNYNDLFLNTKLVSIYLENYIGKTIEDHEISYIALHFGAAIRNAKENDNKSTKVILVCGTGVGTAKMLASQVKDKFYVEIVDTLASRMVSKLNSQEYDLIISSIDIPELNKDAYIKINPMMTKVDVDKLSKHLKVKFKKETSYEEDINLVNKLMNIVNKYCIINDKEQLKYEFMYELKKEKQQFPKDTFAYNLKDLITSEFISLNVECRYWEEAIRKGMKILLEKNYVDKSYEESVIDSLKKIGPYMVVAPGIVLSHGRPENGVNKLSMSLITVKNPVKFGSEINDPVKLVITIAPKDSESHLKALSQLMALFTNSEDLKKVMYGKTKEEVLNIINKYSK